MVGHQCELITLGACSSLTGTRASSTGHSDHTYPGGIHDTHLLRRRLRKITFSTSMAFHSFFTKFSHNAPLTTKG